MHVKRYAVGANDLQALRTQCRRRRRFLESRKTFGLWPE